MAIKKSYVVDRVGKLVVMRLRDLEDKIKIIKNKSKLRNERERLFIEDDLTKDERKIQKHIIRGLASRERGRRDEGGIPESDGEWKCVLIE